MSLKTSRLRSIAIGAFLAFCSTGWVVAQEGSMQLSSQYLTASAAQEGQDLRIDNPPSRFALKLNLLYAATLTPNLQLEIGLGKKTSLELGAGYNFYEADNGKQWKHWLVQPEFRWWFCERFNGSFLGVHAMGGEFNAAKLDLPFSIYPGLKKNRYEGYYYGGGIVFGHQWILGKRWSFEAAIGVGYVRAHYEKYRCATCGHVVDRGVKNYWGPTKAAVSFLFFL